MRHLRHLIPLASRPHANLPPPLQVLLIAALAVALLFGLLLRAVVAVAVIIFGSR